MPNQDTFQSLPLDQLRGQTDVIDVAYQLVAVTLVDGEILLGCLAKHWEWDGKTIWVGYNTAEGKRFGWSYVVEVPVGEVANICPIPLSATSLPRVDPADPALALLRNMGLEVEPLSRLPVQDYPNPLASIICRHNQHIVEVHNLTLLEACEKALSTDAIPPEGIEFGADFLLYADWEYFARQKAGAITAGLSALVFTASKDLSTSLEAEASMCLRQSWLDKARRGTLPGRSKEQHLHGRLQILEVEQTTDIEGERCLLVLCVGPHGMDDEETGPVLLKTASVKYPIEFLGSIASSLVFCGEFLDVPLSVMNRTYKKCLLARAVGYLHQPGV